MTIADQPRPQDKIVLLRRIVLFASCTEEQLQLVAERTRLVEYKKGEVLYREGEVATALYVVASGRLEVFSVIDGAKHLYTVLHNGDTFGEVSLLTGEPHSATVQALNDTLVFQLEKADFEDLINRIPSLVLSLSRLLSRRLRTKGHAVGATEATIVAVYSATRGVGRTLLTVALATSLRRETRQPVIIVDVATPEGQINRFFGRESHPRVSSIVHQGLVSDEDIAHEIQRHPAGFDFLYAAAPATDGGRETVIAPLASELAQRYRYILMDLPVEVDATVLKALTQADLIYLMSDCARESVIRTKALMRQLHDAVGSHAQQMQVMLNLVECGGERLSQAQVAETLERPIDFTLPHIETPSGHVSLDELLRVIDQRESPYARAVRFIARDLGGMLVGLALGSGAALGLAHIGVLKVIERERVPIDLIAGSSIGALVGGLWASGVPAQDLERMALRFKNPWDIRQLFVFDFGVPVVSLVIGLLAGGLMSMMTGLWAGLFFGFIVCVVFALLTGPLVGGPIQGTQLMATLERDFGGKTFEQTRIPLRVVAANPMAREEVIFASGPIAPAVRASVSIPGIFKPVTSHGKLCVDGGVINPVPVSVVKQAGARHVIAVNVFPTTPELRTHLERLQRERAEREAQINSRPLPVRIALRLRQELIHSVSPLVFDVIMRAMQSMEYQIAEVACREADLVLRPTIPGSHWLEFYYPEKFIQRGEEEALRLLPVLKQMTGVLDLSGHSAESA
ncbi:MAG: cyclic nucleotide-binding domain-containing protein [Candidatus Omnitrophica bacterium]|nr:cyclic nucleotide-binding domain-containing protein [Candidatus Omnitrophota bacterium]